MSHLILVFALAIVHVEGKGGELENENHLGAGIVQRVASIVLILANHVADAEVAHGDEEHETGGGGAPDSGHDNVGEKGGDGGVNDAGSKTEEPHGQAQDARIEVLQAGRVGQIPIGGHQRPRGR